MSTPQPGDDALQASAGGFGTPPAGGFGTGGSPPAGGFGGPPAGGFGSPPAGGFGAGGSPPGGSGESERFASFYQGGSPPPGKPPGGGQGSKLGLLLGIGCVALLFVLVAGGAAAWLVLQDQPVTVVEPAVEGAPGIGTVGWSDDDASVPVSSKDATWGSRTAPVTMVVFTEFECPFCVKLARTIDTLKGHYGPSELRIVFKHFPLPNHQQAKPAAAAAQAVFRVGGGKAFWTFHDLAFASSGDPSEAQFDAWVTQAGVDLARYRDQLGAAGAKVDSDISLGKRLGVKGTPSTFINGIFVTGARDAEHFKGVIGEQVAAAGRQRAKGTALDRMYVELCNQNRDKAPAEGTTKPADEKPTDSTTVWAIPVGADDPVRGPAHAPVTIVEFSEYQCPFCQRVQSTLEQIRLEYPTDVRLVWKDNPLPFHKRAEPAAQLAREAFKQKGNAGFWKAHDLLFANQKQLGEADLFRYAGQLGLALGAARQAITTQAHKSILETSMEQASDFDAKGTPHFFINGRRLKGAQPFEKFRAIIDEEIPKAKALLASGVAPSQLYEKLTAEGKAPKGLETVTVAAPQPGAPYKGPPAAPVVIQVFSEFQCPFCARTQATLAEVLREHGHDVKIVFRHKPLAFHQQAQLAAEAAQEAYAQQGNRGFWAFHDKLFQNQKDGGLERPALERYAGQLGLDLAKFRSALDGGVHRGYVDADVRASEAAGITGTPSFVVNGYLIKGAQPYVKFRKAIRRALSDRGGR